MVTRLDYLKNRAWIPARSNTFPLSKTFLPQHSPMDQSYFSPLVSSGLFRRAKAAKPWSWPLPSI